MIPQDTIDKLNKLSVLEVASRLDISVKRKNALCFIHSDTHPSLHFNTDKNTWHCYVCNKGGGCINLVMEKLNLKFVDACIWLANEFNIVVFKDIRWRKTVKTQIKTIRLPNQEGKKIFEDEEVYMWLIKNAKLSEPARNFLFKDRCLSKDVVQSLNIGSITFPKKAITALVSQFGEERCVKSSVVRKGEYGLYLHFYTPCLLFPYYERDGRLTGIQSRYLGEKKDVPRFQFLSSQKTRLFNLPILNKIRKGDKLYISEGITDCLAMLSNGLQAVAIPSATILPQNDLMQLRDYVLYMYPDQDDAGEKAFKKLRRFFINQYITLKVVALPEGVKDYGEYYKLSSGKQQ